MQKTRYSSRKQEKRTTKKAAKLPELQLMLEKPDCAYPTTTIAQASKILVRTRSRGLPIIDSGKRNLSGEITPLDIIDYYAGGKKHAVFLKNYSSLKAAANAPISFIANDKPSTIAMKGKMSDITKKLQTSDTVYVTDGKTLRGEVSDKTLLKIIKNIDFRAKVKQAMKSSVVTATPGYTIRDVCEIMVRNKFSEVPVVQEDDIVGIITATDLLNYFATNALKMDYDEALNERIANIMTTNVKSIRPEESLEKAVLSMIDNDYRALPVFDTKIRGIISQKDVVRFIK